VEPISKVGIDRIDVSERLGDIEHRANLLSRSECTPKPHSFVPTLAPTGLRSVQRDAARRPPSLPSKIDIVLGNVLNHGPGKLECLDDERIDDEHVNLLAPFLSEGPTPRP